MITLNEDEFDPKTGQRKELPDLRKKKPEEEEEKKEGQEMIFRKTKSNNFFSVDDSAD